MSLLFLYATGGESTSERKLINWLFLICCFLLFEFCLQTTPPDSSHPLGKENPNSETFGCKSQLNFFYRKIIVVKTLFVLQKAFVGDKNPYFVAKKPLKLAVFVTFVSPCRQSNSTFRLRKNHSLGITLQ